MTKIYEALVHASEQQKQAGEIRILPAADDACFESPEYLHMDREMLELYQAVESLLPNKPRRIIQFIGSIRGEGTSTICHEFARVAAMKVGKSVLLLDADLPGERHKRRQASTVAECGWLEAVKNGRDIGESLRQVGASSFFMSFLSNNGRLNPEIFDSDLIHLFLEQVRQRFDLTVIDSAPLTASPDCLAIAPKADGIVLVVQAEKTRWTVIESVKEKIAKAGGNILGIAFNKRRFYIPNSIYKRLK